MAIHLNWPFLFDKTVDHITGLPCSFVHAVHLLNGATRPARASGPPPEERHPRDVAQHRLDDFCSAGFFRSSSAANDDIDGCAGNLGITRAFPSSAFLLSRL